MGKGGQDRVIHIAYVWGGGGQDGVVHSSRVWDWDEQNRIIHIALTWGRRRGQRRAIRGDVGQDKAAGETGEGRVGLILDASP